MKRVTVFLLLIAVLCACNTPSPGMKAFTQNMDKFVGRSADDLLAANGIPTNVFMLDSGGRIFEYYKNKALVAQETKNPQALARQQARSGAIPDTRPPSRSRAEALQSYVLSTESSCKLQFTISADNIVERWSSEGDGC